MDKVLSYILPIVVAALTIIPPDPFEIPVPVSYWTYLIAVSGFLGLYLWFINTNLIVKLVGTLAFLNCFFSVAPYLSFSAYIWIVAGCYFYIGCTRMATWDIMWSVLKTVVFLNALCFAIQAIGWDRLFNFGREVSCFGVIGQHMQMGSFSVIISAVLINIHPAFIVFPFITAILCKSVWTGLCAGVGLFFLVQNKRLRKIIILVGLVAFIIAGSLAGKFESNLSPNNGRLVVWSKTMAMMKEHTWTGWGVGTYKAVFPPMSGMPHIFPWRSPHNCWLQILFETGYIGLFFALTSAVGLFFTLCWLSRCPGGAALVAGFLMISLDMCVHFPTRMIQCAPLIIMFLAYCEVYIKRCR